MRRLYSNHTLVFYILLFALVARGNPTTRVATGAPPFRVIAFFSEKNDLAHVSFVKEANQWFFEMAAKNNFLYDTSSNWNLCNKDILNRYQLVIFLDNRPPLPEQRKSFESYMTSGGSWLGFHFAGFALNDSEVREDWHWYHQEFLGSGEYVSNTWRPTAAYLSVETPDHPIAKGLPSLFRSAPNEWYRWKNNLRTNPDIEVLLSIHNSSFPLGTGPKPSEIWYEGDYPVAWTNKKFNMIYCNMGHNDMDYENKTNRTLSFHFSNEMQNRFVLNAVLYLAKQSRIPFRK